MFSTPYSGVAPPSLALRHVGAARQQPHRQIEMPVDRRHEQRARAIGRARLVDVGAAVEQRKRRVVEAVARREEQRGQPALRTHQVGVSERLRLPARVRVAAAGTRAARRRRRSRRHARRRRAFAAASSFWIAATRAFRARLSTLSWRLRALMSTTFAVARTSAPRASSTLTTSVRPDAAANISGVCPHCGSRTFTSAPAIEQDRDGLAAARCGRKVERRRTCRGQRADVGLRADEQANDTRLAAFGGDVERRVPADARPRAGIGARLEEQRGQLLIAMLRRPVKRGHPVALRAIHVSALPQQRANGGSVPLHGGVGDS